MFVKEDKKGQHYYSLIFYISQSEYRKRSEAGWNVNVWEEPGDTLISKLSEHLSLTSVCALLNWTSREVADSSNKVFRWCLALCTFSFFVQSWAKRKHSSEGAVFGEHRSKWDRFLLASQLNSRVSALGLWWALSSDLAVKQITFPKQGGWQVLRTAKTQPWRQKKKQHQALLEHSQNSQFEKNPICISISHHESKRKQQRTSFIISSTGMAITIDSYRILPYEGAISNIFKTNCSQDKNAWLCCSQIFEIIHSPNTEVFSNFACGRALWSEK